MIDLGLSSEGFSPMGLVCRQSAIVWNRVGFKENRVEF
jgi:hypothetical protein